MKNKKIQPHKRWTTKEIATIVNYLNETGNIEQPTAQIYYRKFLAKTQLDASWNLVRWKVRYLRTSYEKAEKWLQSIGANISKVERYKLYKICPHFDKLKNIFGGNNESNVDVCDAETIRDNSCFYPATSTFTTIHNTFERFGDKGNEPNMAGIKIEGAYSLNGLEKNSPQRSSHSAKVTTTPKKRRKSLISSRFIVALTRSQEVQNTNQRLRIKFEKEKFFKEFEFNKEKFKIEAALRKEEIELKRGQVEVDDKLKISEMECKERIAKYELDLKYKSI